VSVGVLASVAVKKIGGHKKTAQALAWAAVCSSVCAALVF